MRTPVTLLTCALVTLAGTARAQNATYIERDSTKGHDIRFVDDPLSALTNDPIGTQLRGWHPTRRSDLMRPKTSFIGEMLRAVETL